MALGLLGIGTGADLQSIVDKLMAIEQKPLDQIKARQATVVNQISTIGVLNSNVSSLKTALSSLRYDYNLRNYSVSSSDNTVATATATSSAAATNYALDVTSLATAHKVASSSYTDANTAIVDPDPSGGGTLTISVGGNSFNIAVSATDTLSTIQDAINNATDNTGVMATVINETGGSRLVLTGKDTGASNTITFSVADNDGNNTDASGLSRLFYYGVGGDGLAETVTAAADAVFSIDGFSMTSASNTVTNAVTGMSISLLASGTSTLNVTQDNGPLQDKLQAVVDAYNTLRTTMDTAKQGSLQGDSLINSINRYLGDAFNTSGGTGQYSHLAEIGLTRDRYGKMSLDTARFNEVMNTDTSSVISLLSDSSTGLASKIYDVADSMMTDQGLLGGREASLNSTNRYLNTQIDSWQVRLDAIRKRYTEKFNQLDSIVTSLQGANSFLNYTK